jgi:hypothetical protein
MKKLLIAALATSAFVASPAFGQASQTINISANVTKACGVGNHVGGDTPAVGFVTGPVALGNIADGNGQFNTARVVTNVTFGNVWCNAPANVTIEVSPLTTSAPAADTSSFTNRLEVEVVTDAAVYTGNPQNTVISSVGGTTATPTALSGNSGGAFETGTGRFGGVDSITIKPASRGSAGGNLRPVAGDYSAFVRFTATPAP